jgi:hypothetical protein
VGESLITNPDPNAVPEEILLYEDPDEGAGYVVLRLSNLVEDGDLVMDVEYINLMREYLSTIHDEFAILYGVEGIEGFGMDIEYKVTAQDQLIIKQARPWVSFWAGIKADDDLAVEELIDPVASSSLGAEELVTMRVANTGLNDMSNFDLSLLVDGELIETLNIPDVIEPFGDAEFQFSVPQNFSSTGDYLITGIVSDPDDGYGNNDTLDFVLSHIHALDASLAIGQVNSTCDGQMGISVVISNMGEEPIESVEILVQVNDQVIDFLEETVDIESQEQGGFSFLIENDDLASSNSIQLAITNVNGTIDGDASNNTTTTTADLEVDFETITLYLLADNYPGETSWKMVDVGSGQIVSEGDLGGGTDEYTEEICVSSSTCLTLYVFDSYGDGMCCGYGQGYFQVWNEEGDLIVSNDGDFGDEAVESFCAGDNGCEILANIDVEHATSSSAEDGSLTINTISVEDSFEYSIDGGQTFGTANSFSGLAPGVYEVVVQNESGTCTFLETVVIDVCAFADLDVTVTYPYSVLTTDGSIVIESLSGSDSYLYSIDGGQNFATSGTFMNLPVGEYNIVVVDESSECIFEFERLLVASGIVDVAEEATDGTIIKVYPNPTSNQFNIEIESSGDWSEPLQILVLDRLGRVLETGSIPQGANRKTISLTGYAPGTYFIKCHTKAFEKNFKVIKI